MRSRRRRKRRRKTRKKRGEWNGRVREEEEEWPQVSLTQCKWIPVRLFVFPLRANQIIWKKRRLYLTLSCMRCDNCREGTDKFQPKKHPSPLLCHFEMTSRGWRDDVLKSSSFVIDSRWTNACLSWSRSLINLSNALCFPHWETYSLIVPVFVARGRRQSSNRSIEIEFVRGLWFVRDVRRSD